MKKTFGIFCKPNVFLFGIYFILTGLENLNREKDVNCSAEISGQSISILSLTTKKVVFNFIIFDSKIEI